MHLNVGVLQPHRLLAAIIQAIIIHVHSVTNTTLSTVYDSVGTEKQPKMSTIRPNFISLDS